MKFVFVRFLAHLSCAPASHRLGRDGACTRLLLCGPEAELPGILSHSLSQRGIGIVGGVARSLDRTTSHTHKNLKVFGLGGGVEAQCLEKKDLKEIEPR